MTNHLPESGVSHEELRLQCLAVWERLPEGLQLRIHRALSWIGRAEQESDDDDAAFIFYWIGFNAIYSEDRQDAEWVREQESFREYFGKIVGLDGREVVYNAIWQRFSNEIKDLLNNRYVFEPFWKHHNRVPGYRNWTSLFAESKRNAEVALYEYDTETVLSILFSRLYVLRNQLIHGGATWRSSVNRDQVRDGRRIMAFLTPIFVSLMVSNPDVDWGAPYYPPVGWGGVGISWGMC